MASNNIRKTIKTIYPTQNSNSPHADAGIIRPLGKFNFNKLYFNTCKQIRLTTSAQTNVQIYLLFAFTTIIQSVLCPWFDTAVGIYTDIHKTLSMPTYSIKRRANNHKSGRFTFVVPNYTIK